MRIKIGPDKLTLLVPLILTLYSVSQLGLEVESSEVDGETIVGMFLFTFGFWILGYISGRSE